MAKYKYLGFKYKQGDSDMELVTFCARAEEIVLWGGVPAKNEQFHGGFQRALSARYKKIVEFFNSGQTSPGAIVVAFREDHLKVEPMAPPTTWATSDLTLAPQIVSLEFETNEDEDASLDDLRKQVLALLSERLKFTSASEDEQQEDESEADKDAANGDAVITEDEDGEEELDVGHSKLRAFFQFLSDDERVQKWLGKETERVLALKSKASLTADQKQYVEFTPEERLKATLKSLVRPAMIVDGQHRVNGANESQKDEIVFTVCAVKDATWIEQVFQFVVLNKMAKPISKDFLTELLNTSLTNDEIKVIDTKLEAVGIRNADRILQKYVNHDQRSPFRGMVAEAGETIGFDREGKLSQQGMLAVAKRWRTIEKGSKSLELAMFLPALGGVSQKLGRQKWREHETWTPFFFAFWRTLRNMYEPQQVWVKSPSFHLLYIVTLQALQDLFLESKADGGVKFQCIQDFENQVKEFFTPVPAVFFQGWSATGLQSGTGWEDIKAAVQMLRKGNKLNTVKANSPLFK